MSDGGQAFREGDTRQAGAAVKGVLADGCQAFSEGDTGQTGAVLERVIADGQSAFPGLHVGQSLRGGKGISADGSHPGRQNRFRQGIVVIERIVTDLRKAPAEGRGGQRRTAPEGTGADGPQALREADTRQSGTAEERVFSNVRHTLRDHNAGQGGAVLERGNTDGLHALGDHHVAAVAHIGRQNAVVDLEVLRRAEDLHSDPIGQIGFIGGSIAGIGQRGNVDRFQTGHEFEGAANIAGGSGGDAGHGGAGKGHFRYTGHIVQGVVIISAGIAAVIVSIDGGYACADHQGGDPAHAAEHTLLEGGDPIRHHQLVHKAAAIIKGIGSDGCQVFRQGQGPIKTGAAIERTGADFGYGVRDHKTACQAGAILERVASDFGNALTQFQPRQAAAAVKSIGIDNANTAGEHKISLHSGTVIERVSHKGCQAFREGDFRQSGTSIEGTGADYCQCIGQRHRFQRGMIIECLCADFGDTLANDQGGGLRDLAAPVQLVRDLTGARHIQGILFRNTPGNAVADLAVGNQAFRKSAVNAASAFVGMSGTAGVRLHEGLCADPAGVGGIAVGKAQGGRVHARVCRFVFNCLYAGINAAQGKAVVLDAVVRGKLDLYGVTLNGHRLTRKAAAGIGSAQRIISIIQPHVVIAILYIGFGSEGKLQILRALAGIGIPQVCTVGVAVRGFRIPGAVLKHFCVGIGGMDIDVILRGKLPVRHRHRDPAAFGGVTGYDTDPIRHGDHLGAALGILCAKLQACQVDLLAHLIHDFPGKGLNRQRSDADRLLRGDRSGLPGILCRRGAFLRLLLHAVFRRGGLRCQERRLRGSGFRFLGSGGGLLLCRLRFRRRGCGFRYGCSLHRRGGLLRRKVLRKGLQGKHGEYHHDTQKERNHTFQHGNDLHILYLFYYTVSPVFFNFNSVTFSLSRHFLEKTGRDPSRFSRFRSNGSFRNFGKI